MSGVAERPITMQDVATDAGVSVSTVSRVLSGGASVDRRLAEKVRISAETLGYLPDLSARYFRKQRLPFIQYIVPNSSAPFFVDIQAAMENIVWSKDFQVLMCGSSHSIHRENMYIRSAIANRVSGVAISPLSTSQSDLTPLLDAGIPTVLLDRDIPRFPGVHVGTNNYLAGGIAAEHLAEQGVKRVLCVTSDPDVSVVEERKDGFVSGSRRLGMEVVATIRSSDTVGLDQRLMDELRKNLPVDAIFCTSGRRTAKTFRALSELGVKIAEDLLFIGFDNELWTELVAPTVTVIKQPVDEIGRVVAEQLVEQISSSPSTDVKRISMNPTLLVRGSSSWGVATNGV